MHHAINTIIKRLQYESISGTAPHSAIQSAIRSKSDSMNLVLSGIQILDVFVLRYKGQACNVELTSPSN